MHEKKYLFLSQNAECCRSLLKLFPIQTHNY